MDFTALRYFFETAGCGSIRRAAERIHVAPSAISRQIAKLEHDLGSPLLERGSNGVRLTAGGDLLLQQLKLTMRDLSRVRSQLDDLKGLRRGEVTVACIEGLVDFYLPSAISAFHQRHPQIAFHLIVSSTDAILESLASGEVDIGIALNPTNRPEISICGGWEEALCAVVSHDHPLAKRKAVELKELVAFPAALPNVTFGVRRLVDRALSRAKVALNVQVTTNSILATCGMAELGSFYTLLPPFAFHQSLTRKALVGIPVKSNHLEPASVAIAVHSRRRLPLAATEFLTGLQSASADRRWLSARADTPR